MHERSPGARGMQPGRQSPRVPGRRVRLSHVRGSVTAPGRARADPPDARRLRAGSPGAVAHVVLLDGTAGDLVVTRSGCACRASSSARGPDRAPLSGRTARGRTEVRSNPGRPDGRRRPCAEWRSVTVRNGWGAGYTLAAP